MWIPALSFQFYVKTKYDEIGHISESLYESFIAINNWNQNWHSFKIPLFLRIGKRYTIECIIK